MSDILQNVPFAPFRVLYVFFFVCFLRSRWTKFQKVLLKNDHIRTGFRWSGTTAVGPNWLVSRSLGHVDRPLSFVRGSLRLLLLLNIGKCPVRTGHGSTCKFKHRWNKGLQYRYWLDVTWRAGFGGRVVIKERFSRLASVIDHFDFLLIIVFVIFVAISSRRFCHCCWGAMLLFLLMLASKLGFHLEDICAKPVGLATGTTTHSERTGQRSGSWSLLEPIVEILALCIPLV